MSCFFIVRAPIAPRKWSNALAADASASVRLAYNATSAMPCATPFVNRFELCLQLGERRKPCVQISEQGVEPLESDAVGDDFHA
jgi:hypothetical protein